MDWQVVQYLFPYVVSLAISYGVGLYAWHQRHMPGAVAFAFVAWAQALWTFGYIFELASSTLPGKIFWDDFQWIWAIIWPVALLVFALQYTNHRLVHPFRTIGLMALPFAAFLVLAATNRFHRLVRTGETLIPGVPFDELFYDFTLPVWMLFVWGVVVALFSLGLLITRYIRPHRLYRAQVGIIIVGTVIPLIGVVLTMMGITPTFHRDITPLTFVISNLCIAWGLYHYRLLDVVPIARDRIFESMVDSVTVLDTHERVVDLNPAAAQGSGAPPHTLIGQPVEFVFPQWLDLLGRFRGSEQIQTEIEVEEKGQLRHLELQINPLKDRSGRPRGRLIVSRDISAHKRVEQELRAANEKLQSLSRVKDEFVSNVSHELAAPITSIKLYLSLFARKHGQSEEPYIVALQREVARLEDLINGLLLLSRMDQGRMRCELGEIDLNALVGQYVSDRVPLANSKELTLGFQPTPELKKVSGDSSLLGQVISILLTNAFNYTPAGGQVAVRTQARQQDGQTWCGFCIQDNGLGITPDEIPHLFERFFRGAAGYASGAPGTGLGLAIAQEIIQRHRGKIEVASNGIAGNGTQFSVWLPVDTSNTQ